MGRYGTREDEVDRLLREGVLVDLLRVVRQSLRASVESYSIKKMEAFYGFVREIDLRDAGSSIVAFEQWLELGEGERPEATTSTGSSATTATTSSATCGCATGSRRCATELAAATGPRRSRARSRATPTLPAELTEAQARVAGPRRAARRPGRRPDRSRRTGRRRSRRRWLLAQLLGWHRREDKSMWWDFHRLMDLTPEQLVDEDDPIGLLEPVGPVDERTQGQADLALSASPTRTTTSAAARLYDPADKQARPDDNPFNWAVGDVVAVDPAERTVDIRRDRRPSRIRGRSCRSTGSGPGITRRRCSSSASGSPSTASRRPDPYRAGARPAAPPAAAGRPVARTRRCAAPARPTSTAARRLALDARPHDARHPGAARLRQDLHRRPDDLLAARSRASGSGSPARATRSSATCSTAVLEAAGESRASTSGRSSTATRSRCSTIRGSSRGEGRRRMSAAGSTTAGRTSPPARPGCGRRRRWPTPSTSCSSTRPARSRWPTSSPWRARPTASSCSATRSSSTSRCRARTRPAPTGRRWPTSSATTRRCRPTAACSSRRPGACIPTCARFTSEVFYDDRLEPEPHLAVQRRRSRPGRVRRRHRPAPGRRRRRSAPTTSRPMEAEAVADARPVARRGRRRRGSTQTGVDAAGRLGRRPRSSRRTTRRSARSRRRLPRGGPGRDGRQVPGPGGADQHLLDDDLEPRARAARHGLPVQPQPAERRDLARAVRGRRRRLARPAARARPDAGADAAGERVLPVRRGRREPVRRASRAGS